MGPCAAPPVRWAWPPDRYFVLAYGEHDTDRAIRPNQALAARLADHPCYRQLAGMLRRSTA